MEILKLNMKNQLRLIIFLFIILMLSSILGCEGWSVMGYALDKSQDSTQVKIKEINE